MKKVPPALRFVITAAIFFLYIMSLVAWNVFDGIIKAFVPGVFLIGLAVGFLCAGITYGVLPGKKTVQQSKDAFAEKPYRQAVIGYWTWVLIWGIFCIFWIPFYTIEM